ncbi:glutaredoxin-like domain protein [Hydrogenobaculum sp. Y04AAS1]|uniref:protein disulfide oxidoreductase n=1 Tax=Hydrogenobaculum sp. (strain Y04AAS1) TaxID=380749 RepID=UPI00017BBD9D|nr:glutaredoxin-like domain protein [Hydrogenobaculum sp. Y04AAS1]HCT66974.1 glutaredoxin [Hydrogenobaculum sp.]
MLLDLETRAQLKDIFEKNLKEPVKLKLFSQAIGCESCGITEQLMQEVKEVGGDKLSLEIVSPLTNQELASSYGIERVPTLAIEGEKDYGIRYIGLPAGLEFNTLIHGIIQVSQRDPGLKERTLEILKDVDVPIDIMVFVTTSCGYCPAAAITAFKFAIANDYITSKAIDASENMDLSERFQVVGVPKIVLNNGLTEFVGAQPEEAFLGYITSVASKLKSLN